MGRAVEMRAEFHAVLVNLAAFCQAENLITPTIGEDWLVPAHELVEAAAPSNQLIARPKHQVIGVSKDDARADLVQVTRRQRFNRALRPDRHEDGRFDFAVSCRENAAPGAAISVG